MKTIYEHELRRQIQSYLGNGGLWNPEAMEHDKVRQLIMDFRDYLDGKPSIGLTPRRLKLSEAKPQMRVAYVPSHATLNSNAVEYGTVSSTNHKFVFVKFDKQLDRFGWEGTTSQSCVPEDLISI